VDLVVLLLHRIILLGQFNHLADPLGSQVNPPLLCNAVVVLTHVDDHGVLIELGDVLRRKILLQLEILVRRVDGLLQILLWVLREGVPVNQVGAMLVDPGGREHAIVKTTKAEVEA